MFKMRELTSVDADFALIGLNRNTLRQPIAVSAATLYNCLADGPAWRERLGIDVGWTTPEPHGVGTTRTITTARQTIEENFLTWDEGERFAFRFDRCTLPLQAFAEHYECVSRGDAGCFSARPAHSVPPTQWRRPRSFRTNHALGLSGSAYDRNGSSLPSPRLPPHSQSAVTHPAQVTRSRATLHCLPTSTNTRTWTTKASKSGICCESPVNFAVVLRPDQVRVQQSEVGENRVERQVVVAPPLRHVLHVSPT